MRVAAATLFVAVIGLWTGVGMGVARPVGAAQLLYTSYWGGRSQVYALAADGRVSQLTFGAYPCGDDVRCGVVSVAAAPNGQRLLLQTPSPDRRLFVADADGRRRRAVGIIGASDGVWSHDGKRIAYLAADGLHVVRDDGSFDRRLGPGNSPAWSPVTDKLAFLRPSGPGMALVVWKSNRPRIVTSIPGACCTASFSWSPDGLRVAIGGEGLTVMRTDGKSRRVLTHAPVSGEEWSRDGRHLAWSEPGRLLVADADSRRMHTLVAQAIYEPLWWAWSPDGRQLAYATADTGVWLTNPTTAGSRRLAPLEGGSLYWTPDSRSIVVYNGRGSVHVVSLAGRVRTLLSAAQATVVPPSLGRDIDNDFIRIAGWTRPPTGTTYRKPAALRPALDIGMALIAPWAITKVAASGGQIAFAACGHVIIWTPSDHATSQVDRDPSLAPNCSNGSYNLFDLGLAEGQVAYGEVEGGIGQTATLTLRDLSPDGTTTLLDEVHSTGPSFPTAVGQLAGAGPLLVYGNWASAVANGAPTTVVSETIHSAAGCPCTIFATRGDGPLVPLDVDEGRILVNRGDELDLLSTSGTALVKIPLTATDAALSGRQLVATTGSELRVYDATTGALDRRLPLPGPATPRCRAPRCTSSQDGTVLVGTAHGQAAYITDGVLHVIRLDTGTETFTTTSTTAAFYDGGLAYATGDELHVLPTD